MLNESRAVSFAFRQDKPVQVSVRELRSVMRNKAKVTVMRDDGGPGIYVDGGALSQASMLITQLMMVIGAKNPQQIESLLCSAEYVKQGKPRAMDFVSIRNAFGAQGRGAKMLFDLVEIAPAGSGERIALFYLIADIDQAQGKA